MEVGWREREKWRAELSEGKKARKGVRPDKAWGEERGNNTRKDVSLMLGSRRLIAAEK